MRTVATDLLAGQMRGAAMNSGTSAMRPIPRVSEFRALFTEHYPTFAPQLRSMDEPAVAVVAIHDDRSRVGGILRLAARPERVVAAIIGRHGCADLFLDGPEDLSLRHLAVLVEPARTWRKGSSDVAYRLIDLRTGAGFLDEHGSPLVSVRCEGTAFFRFGTLAFLFLAVGDPTDWPESADDAWGMIPERVMFDERTHRESRPPARRLAEGSCLSRVMGGPGTTLVVSMPAPQGLDRYGTGENPVGEFELECDGHVDTIDVGVSSLNEGILIGRYARCDSAQLITDETVSRTHLLVISVGGRVCALDTGSTNGTLREGARVRIVELRDECALKLGSNTSVLWRRRRG